MSEGSASRRFTTWHRTEGKATPGRIIHAQEGSEGRDPSEALRRAPGHGAMLLMTRRNRNRESLIAAVCFALLAVLTLALLLWKVLAWWFAW